MSADEADRREADLAARLATIDEAVRGGASVSTADGPDLTPALNCLRLLEEIWPRHPNNVPTIIRPALAAALASESSGTTPLAVGRFQIIRELGRGGFGIVYLARDPQLHREVALKVQRAEAALSPDLRQRFEKEARAAAGLNHPNLVQVYEAGESNGTLFIASAYCPGPNLAEWLRGRTEPVPVRDAAALVATLAGAVDHAHSRGILHRDLKPANVLLSVEVDPSLEPDDTMSSDHDLWPTLNSQLCIPESAFRRPRITDFGLAKFVGADAVTQTGAAMGTPSYMAPEQAAGQESRIGLGADIYSLGVILYELITGRPPFLASNAIETLLLARTEEPLPPSRLRHRLPRDLETISLKCLEKEPARRYLSAAELAGDLTRFLRNEPICARPAGPVGRAIRWARREPIRAMLLATLALVVVIGSMGVGWQWRRAEVNASQARASAEQAQRDRDSAVEERARAERNLQRARQAFDRLQQLGSTMTGKPGLEKTGREVLEEVLAFQRSILEERSNDPEVRYHTGRAAYKVASIYQHFGEWDKSDSAYREALAMLNPLVSEYPENLTYRGELTDCLIWHAHGLRDRMQNHEAIADYHVALKHIEALTAATPGESRYVALRANVVVNLAVPLMNEGRLDEAERCFEESVQMQRDLATISGNRGSGLALALDAYGTLLRERGRAADALPYVREALEIREKWVSRRLRNRMDERYLARSYMSLGRVLDSLNQPDAAIDAHQKGLDMINALAREFGRQIPSINVHLVDAWLALGDTYDHHGRPADALAAYRTAMSLATKTHGNLNNIAWRLATASNPKSRDPGTAVLLAEQAVQQEPKYGSNWNTLGIARYRNGEWAKCLDALKQAISLRGDKDASDHYFVAMALARTGDALGAREYLDRARQLHARFGPNDAELKRFRTEAEALIAPAK